PVLRPLGERNLPQALSGSRGDFADRSGDRPGARYAASGLFDREGALRSLVRSEQPPRVDRHPPARNPSVPQWGALMEPVPREVRELALLHSIQPAYRGMNGQRARASESALLATLRALGVPVDGRED